jgi:pimeloyl-ACP methyl ester carboxylesterase
MTRTAKVVQADGFSLATESFGSPGDAPILLVMGAMSSGVWWPKDFCQALAARRRFVIRYDHRDTGASTSYPPGQASYTVEDLADDAMRVLDGYGIERAHLVGMSLGGYLAQLLALKYPQRVSTITLVASERLASADPNLPGISPAVLDYHARAAALDWSDHGAVIEYQIGAWRLLAGSAHPFEANLIREMAEEDLARTPNPLTAFNHASLPEADGWIDRMHEIRVPALVIHGTDDIVLPYAHALALQDALPDATLLTLNRTGHELARGDWPKILDALERHTALPFDHADLPPSRQRKDA